MKSTDYLNAAAAIQRARAAEYDKPEGERSMAQTVVAFNAITGQDLTESQGWEFMCVLKQVRLFSKPGFHQDSAEDLVSYAALLAESKETEKVTSVTADFSAALVAHTHVHVPKLPPSHECHCPVGSIYPSCGISCGCRKIGPDGKPGTEFYTGR
jgi:hypothetical protein